VNTAAGERFVVAMSGGVDSSVSAALAARQGGDLVGLSMQLYDQTRDGGGSFGRCCTPADLADARRVAERVGIPHYVMNFESDFRRHVLDYFAAEYRQGRTPIPCIPCNSTLKFGRLLERAGTLGARKVITGHYARVDFLEESGRWRLRAGVDRERDQSYFLFDLSQEQLAAAVFPLGGLRKQEVRDLAREFGLPVAEKPESRDLCFVAGGSYRDILERDATGLDESGEVVDGAGNVLGRHAGVSGFTVGQRRGLGVASARRLYVLSLDPGNRRVVVGGEDEQYCSSLVARGANWIFQESPSRPFDASVRVRYRHGGARGKVYPATGGEFRVEFQEPQRAISPGQAAVLYRDEEVLGGGWIDSAS
jgi:tRNA-specific 2-thiouridylase